MSGTDLSSVYIGPAGSVLLFMMENRSARIEPISMSCSSVINWRSREMPFWSLTRPIVKCALNFLSSFGKPMVFSSCSTCSWSCRIVSRPFSMPTHTTRGRFRLGKQPMFLISISKGLTPGAARSHAARISGIRSSSTFPRNFSVTWMLCGTTHLTPAPDAANRSISLPIGAWSALSRLRAMNVRMAATDISLAVGRQCHIGNDRDALGYRYRLPRLDR